MTMTFKHERPSKSVASLGVSRQPGPAHGGGTTAIDRARNSGHAALPFPRTDASKPAGADYLERLVKHERPIVNEGFPRFFSVRRGGAHGENGHKPQGKPGHRILPHIADAGLSPSGSTSIFPRGAKGLE